MKPDASRAFVGIPDGKWPGPAVAALKALGNGEARPEQQVAAVNFLIEELCRTYDLSFRPEEKGGERETAFAEGKRSVGLQIRRAMVEPFEKLVGRTYEG